MEKLWHSKEKLQQTLDDLGREELLALNFTLEIRKYRLGHLIYAWFLCTLFGTAIGTAWIYGEWTFQFLPFETLDGKFLFVFFVPFVLIFGTAASIIGFKYWIAVQNIRMIEKKIFDRAQPEEHHYHWMP